MYLYQLAFNGGSKLLTFDELTEKCEVTGWNENSGRKELHDQPKIYGFCGPMYNGKNAEGYTIIRYETPEHYATYAN